MTVDVLTDHPEPDRVRRLFSRLGTTLAGGLLLAVSVVASFALVPMAFGVLGVLAGATRDELQGFSDAAIVAAAVLLLVVVIATSQLGLRMLRGNRELVLLLRRFGYDDATQVATFAAKKTIGRSWGLVTLDDADVAPVGVTSALTGAVKVVALVKRGGYALFSAFKWMYFIAFWAVAAIIGLTILQDGSLEPYADIGVALTDGRIPEEAFEPTLTGVVATCGVALALCLLAACFATALLVVAVLLAPLLVAGGNALSLARQAEEGKLRRVDDAAAADKVARDLESSSRKIFAPRLVVLRVDSSVWQLTVRRLASAGALTIIDVSEPTENLLWEVQELSDRLGPRCVFIGHHDRVVQLTAAGGARGPLDERLLLFLEGREVLTYRTDRESVRRFARALQARLLDVSSRVGERTAGALREPATADVQRVEEELAAYDEVVARYGDSGEPAQRERVANALEDKAVTLGNINRIEEMFVACNELISRFGDSTEPPIRGRVDEGLANKARALAALQRHDEHLVVLDDIARRRAAGPDETPPEPAAALLVDRAAVLERLGRHEEALTICDSVIATYADSSQRALRVSAAAAKVTKGISLGALGRSQEAFALYDEVIESHRNATEPALQMAVATALHKRYMPDSSESIIGRLGAVRNMMRARSGKS